MQRRDERRLGSFLVYSASSYEDGAKFWFFYQLRVPRRRRPLGRINLLYVVHEVEAERAGCARIERGENSGLAVGRNFGDFTKSGFAEETHREVAAFADTPILRRNGWLVNPLLQSLHRFVMLLGDLREDWFEIFVVRDCCGCCGMRQCKSCRAGCCALKEGSSVHGKRG